MSFIFENVKVYDGVNDHYYGFFIDCIAKSCKRVRNSKTFAKIILNAGSNSYVNSKLDISSQVIIRVLPISVFKH